MAAPFFVKGGMILRKLMWFTIGFGLACILCVWVLNTAWIIPAAVVGAISAFVCRKFRLRRPAVLLLGCCVGLVWYFGFAKLYLIPAQVMDGTTIETTVTATGYSYDTDYGVGVDGEFTLNGKKYKIRLYVNSTQEIMPGEQLSGTFKLRYSAPGGMRDPTYHAGEGILFLGYERGSAVIRKSAEKADVDFGIFLNHSIGQRLTELFPGDVEALARALLLGDDFDLSYETDTALKISGIRHVVAVSGLHVAILYTILQILTFNRLWLTALIGLPMLYLFAAVALFTPSVSRACAMVGLMMISQLLDKEYDQPTALSFSALVMLLENPLVITSISFQMSIACVTGILRFQAPIGSWMKEKLGKSNGKRLRGRIRRWFISSVSISLSAMVLTAPLSAYYFGAVSIIGPLTNLLTLWAVSFGFYGIVTVSLVSLVWIKAAAFLAQLTALLLRYVIWMARLLAAFPLAAVYTKSVYIVFWMVFVYVLLVIYISSAGKRPALLGFCAAAGLCAALMVSWTEHTRFDTHLTVLDVGQGQSLILHHDGKTFLIDCGGSNDEIAANEAVETLLSRGIRRVDGVILTHADRDHAGGLPYFLSRIGTELILYPATTQAGIMEQMTTGYTGKLLPVDQSLLMTMGEANLQIFGPVYAAESNENSLCILFGSEKCAILVTGDRGMTGELFLLEYPLADVDFLIAGHHGSKYSTSQALLERVRPEVVAISVGKNNSYGHPAQETLDRLKGFGCRIFRTDQDGTIIFRR